MKNLQGSQWGPLHPRTENFMFVLSQEAHVSLVGREKRVGRPTGKLLSSFVPGGWVSTAEVKCKRCPCGGHPKSLTLSSSWWERRDRGVTHLLTQQNVCAPFQVCVPFLPTGPHG